MPSQKSQMFWRYITSQCPLLSISMRLSILDVPCRHCRSAASECVYPTRDRSVTVSEAYLRALEGTVVQFNHPEPTPNYQNDTPALHSQDHSQNQAMATVRPYGGEKSSKSQFVENTTADAFISRLRRLGTNRSIPGFPQASQQETASTESQVTGEGSADQENVPQYEYFPLPSDRNCKPGPSSSSPSC